MKKIERHILTGLFINIRSSKVVISLKIILYINLLKHKFIVTFSNSALAINFPINLK